MNFAREALEMEETELFEVLEPGMLTVVEDGGRWGFSRFGVPPSGAADPFSFRAANLLVGNREGEACLEITLMGLSLKVLGEGVIAITGGDFSPMLNGEALEMWRSHLVIGGDILTFKRVRSGCRAYLAAWGGISVPEVMGSKSTYLSGKFGGLEGRALKRGDRLRVRNSSPPLSRLGIRFPGDWIPSFGKEITVRVIPGPEDDHFTEMGLQTFSSSLYKVTPHSDRMGIRLEGPKIERRPDVEESIISEGLLPGAIQVPGDGRPIIILTDLVTGGYTKIATVISTDLPMVAQLKPGDKVGFRPIPIEEAHRLLREQEERLEHFRRSIEIG